VEDNAKSALAIIRDWDWMDESDHGQPFMRSQELSQIINRLGFEGHTCPPDAVLKLLCSGELESSADFDWRKLHGSNDMRLQGARKCLKPMRWQALANLIELENEAVLRGDFALDKVELKNLSIEKCYPFDWSFANDRFNTAACSCDVAPWDAEYFEEWFSAWDIQVWPRELNPQGLAAPAIEGTGEIRSGGRRAAKWWPDFAEELAVYLHDFGLPDGHGHDGQSEVVKAVFDRLAAAGKPEPGRSAVQPVINAVLERIRSAGN